MANDLPDDKVQIACRPCTERAGRPVMVVEAGQFTTDASTPGAPAVGILGLRLMCPVCSKQSFYYPTVKHYECESCGHVKETYIRGGTSQTPKGISYQEKGDGSDRAESQSILEQLRKGSIGGWGSA